MDLNLALTIGGILLTVLTFAIGYRKTIGALNERADVANRDLSNTLVKHFLLTNHVLSRSEILMMRSGRALTAGVKAEKMVDVNGLKALVTWGVLENQYLEADKKQEALKRIEKSFLNHETRLSLPNFVYRPMNSILSRSARDVSGFFGSTSFLLAVSSVMISSLVILIISRTALLDSQNFEKTNKLGLLGDVAPAIFAAITVSLSMVIFLELKKRSSVSIVNTSEADKISKVHQNVMDSIFNIPHENKFDLVDYVIVDGIHRVGIEIVDFDFYPSQSGKLASEWSENATKKHDLERIIVVADSKSVKIFAENTIPDNVLVMTVEDFDRYIKEIASR